MAMTVIYFLLLFLNCLGNVLDLFWVDLLTKPLLMPVLAFWFYKQFDGVIPKAAKWILAALFFSFLGDVFLMFQKYSPHFFTAGLGAFLVAHISYVCAFIFSVNKEKLRHYLAQQPLFIVPVLLFQFAFIYSVWASLGEMKFPVLFYSSAISAMAAFAIDRKNVSPYSSFLRVMVGAICFIVSDTIIGINKFRYAIPYAGLAIMLLYGLGQWLIVKGMKMQLK